MTLRYFLENYVASGEFVRVFNVNNVPVTYEFTASELLSGDGFISEEYLDNDIYRVSISIDVLIIYVWGC